MNKSKEPFGINPSGEGDSWESLAGDLFGIDFNQEVEPVPTDIEEEIADEIEDISAEEESPTESQVEQPVVEKSSEKYVDDNYFGSSIFDDEEFSPSAPEAAESTDQDLEPTADFEIIEEEDLEEELIEVFEDEDEFEEEEADLAPATNVSDEESDLEEEKDTYWDALDGWKLG